MRGRFAGQGIALALPQAGGRTRLDKAAWDEMGTNLH
jgi:hypothetical protein